jgi:hypothetical protein
MNKVEFNKLKAERLNQSKLREMVEKPAVLIERRTTENISSYFAVDVIIKEVKNSKRSNNIEVHSLESVTYDGFTCNLIGTYISQDGLEKFYSSGTSVTSFFVNKK